MTKKYALLVCVWTAITIAASVFGTMYLAPKAPAPKQIVTVDIQKLIRNKAAQLVKEGKGDQASDEARIALAQYSERLDEKLADIANEANVVIFVKQPVVAGASKDITDMLMEF